ncbi:MAG: transglycosylase SLT domain-containing protein, partial [Geopsychrobacter sp.]|nr:transglycosylase SLT domain-containing protein [Geopsychrobacter sp.]
MARGSWFMVLGLLLGGVGVAAAADPWGDLRDQFKIEKKLPVIVAPSTTPAPKVKTAPVAKVDPWAQLQAIFVPFTPEEEEIAQTDPLVRKKVAAKLNRSLAPYAELISEASARFDVPIPVIAAVIMVESGGNPRASANSSSAKGLMQTINATFAEARQAL